MNTSDAYGGVAILFWLVVFAGAWIGCIANYGFLLGVGLGWFPAAIVATIAALLWPLLLLAVGAGLYFLYRN